MALCINKNLSEFQMLKNMSGLHEFIVEAYCSDFAEKYGRFPHLDELPDADSSAYLSLQIGLRKNGANIENILDYTGAGSIEEANILLNNTYRDLEIELTPLNKEAYVEIKKRPTVYGKLNETLTVDENINSTVLLTTVLQKLLKLYGINIIPTTTYDIEHGDLALYVPDAAFTNAFVFNGNIYVNTDVADVDAPLHEMLHMFIGSIRFTDPNLYQELLQGALNFLDYQDMISQMPNRTQNDINEEILVLELAKHLAGMPSLFDNMDERTRYEISYNVNRMLDSIFMGDVSTLLINPNELMDLSLRTIASKVNSNLMQNKFPGYLDDLHIHRLMMNTKQQLIKEGKLKEVCQ